MPSEESPDWDRILEERLAREAARRPTAPLPEGAKHAEAAGATTLDSAPSPASASALARSPSRAQFEGTVPFSEVASVRQISPEEEEEAAEYLRSIPRTRKLILSVVLLATAAVFGGAAFVAGRSRPVEIEERGGDFSFVVEPAGLRGFSPPSPPKVVKKPPEFAPGLDPLPEF